MYMETHTMHSRTNRIAAIMAVVVLCQVAAAETNAPTHIEIACADEIGINLRTAAWVESPTIIRRLTWPATLIITGTVTGISHDYDPPYLTTVAIRVESVLKGATPYREVYIDQITGPLGDGTSLTNSNEVSFHSGEVVLVFLHTSYPPHPTTPDYWAHREGHYSLSSWGKYLIEDGLIRTQSPPTEQSFEWAQAEIRLTLDHKIDCTERMRLAAE